MKKSKFLFLLLSFMMMSATALAQKRTYTGTVVDDQNEPVIGASVVQKGTSNGTVTDFDGNFSVSVDEGSTLVISYIGLVTQEVKAANNLRIVLKAGMVRRLLLSKNKSLPLTPPKRGGGL